MRAHKSKSITFAAVAVATALAATLSGCSIIGTISDVVEGKEDVFSIKVGECFNSDIGDESVEISSVKKPACTEEHDYEAYHAWDISESDIPEWNEDAIFEAADAGCFDKFESFIGAAYDETNLDFSYFYPTAASWEQQSDREILCMVFDRSGTLSEPVEGKGANYPYIEESAAE